MPAQRNVPPTRTRRRALNAIAWIALAVAVAAAAYFAGRRAGAVQELETGESLLLTPDEGTDRIVLNGGGEVVLVKLTPTQTRP